MSAKWAANIKALRELLVDEEKKVEAKEEKLKAKGEELGKAHVEVT